MVNLHKVWNRTRIELATPGTPVSIEKNDSVNMHKAAESYSVNAADILGWLHDILRFFNNCLKFNFISKWKKVQRLFTFNDLQCRTGHHSNCIAVEPSVKN